MSKKSKKRNKNIENNNFNTNINNNLGGNEMNTQNIENLNLKEAEVVKEENVNVNQNQSNGVPHTPTYVDQMTGQVYSVDWRLNNLLFEIDTYLIKSHTDILGKLFNRPNLSRKNVKTIVSGKIVSTTNTHLVVYLGGYLFAAIDRRDSKMDLVESIVYPVSTAFDNAMIDFLAKYGIINPREVLFNTIIPLIDFYTRNIQDPSYLGRSSNNILLSVLTNRGIKKTLESMPHVKEVNSFIEIGSELRLHIAIEGGYDTPYQNYFHIKGDKMWVRVQRDEVEGISPKVDYIINFKSLDDMNKYIKSIFNMENVNDPMQNSLYTLISILMIRDFQEEIFNSDILNFYTKNEEGKYVLTRSPFSTYVPKEKDLVVEEEKPKVNPEIKREARSIADNYFGNLFSNINNLREEKGVNNFFFNFGGKM